jgi:hypothetical protein
VSAPRTGPDWRVVAQRQAGAITRSQAIAAGLTDSGLRAKVGSKRWQRLFHGVYLTYPTDPVLVQRAWAALAAGGKSAVLSHTTAAELHGIFPEKGGPITLSVPANQHPRRATPGIEVYRRRSLWPATGNPARTSPTHTLVDLVSIARDPLDVVGLVTHAFGRAVVDSDQLRQIVTTLPTLAHRELLLEVTESAADGVRSPLEYRYRRDVERAHGLPHPVRQSRRKSHGHTLVIDLEYDEFLVTIELDGRLNHESTPKAFRDMARDNAHTLAGRANLRYGWASVAGLPCATAAQVATVLKAHGWSGEPNRCGPHCAI